MHNISMIAAYFEYLDLVQLEVKLWPWHPYLWKDLDGYRLQGLLTYSFIHFAEATLSDKNTPKVVLVFQFFLIQLQNLSECDLPNIPLNLRLKV